MRCLVTKARSWIAFSSCAQPLTKSSEAFAGDDALRKTIADFDAKVDTVRKLIVATKEGGAVTGEERLRENTDKLYGAILSYEGKPADYQVASIEALKRELADATNEFEQLIDKELPTLNETLKAKGQQPIPPPPAKVAINGSERRSGGPLNGSADPDLPGVAISLPTDFLLLH